VTKTTQPIELKLTAGTSTTLQTIRRIDPHESFQTLGVYVTPIGASDRAMEVLLKIALSYTKTVSSSHLSRETALVSYIQHILPKIRFQLPALTLTKAQCHRLTSRILMALLPKKHVN
jgi:hypothetical protein